MWTSPSPLALLLLQRPEKSPFADVLGWIVIFFVVIWPIIRGLLETAQQRRKDFEAIAQGKTRRRSPKDEAVLERRRVKEWVDDPSGALPWESDPLEEYEEGFTPPWDEDPDGDPEDEDEPMPPPRVVPPKPRAEPKASAHSALAPPSADGTTVGGGAFGGDPFDDALMDQALVPRSETKLSSLEPIPTEDELEEAPEELLTSPSSSPFAGLGTRLGQSATMETADVDGSDDQVVLERLGRRATPWQRAFILREVLGPPRGSQDGASGGPF